MTLLFFFKPIFDTFDGADAGDVRKKRLKATARDITQEKIQSDRKGRFDRIKLEDDEILALIQVLDDD